MSSLKLEQSRIDQRHELHKFIMEYLEENNITNLDDICASLLATMFYLANKRFINKNEFKKALEFYIESFEWSK